MEGVEFFNWKLNIGKPFSCLKISYPGSFKRHLPDMHSALHLAFVLHGKRTGGYSGKILTSSAGEFYLTAPWEPHYTVSVTPQHRLILLNIDWESLQSTFFTGRERLENLILLPPEQRMEILNKKLQPTGLGKELEQLTGLPESLQKELYIWNLIQKIFITALPEQMPINDSSGNYQRLLPALKELSNQLVRAEQAAAKCHMSPGYFALLFKKQFGMSFGRYERNFRLNGAEAAVRSGRTLKEAADFWDFCDKSHLARLLRKRMQEKYP